MDSNRLDDFARVLGSGQSRRRILKTLAGGALGAMTAAVGLGEAGAAARCRAQGVVCSKNADCCSTACLPKDRTGRRYCAECSSPAQCPAATDACHAAACLGGSCGFTVQAGAPCNGGTCDADGTCAPADFCDGLPTDLQTDDANCGECGNRCGGYESCLSGTCGCRPGERFCNGYCAGPCSADTAGYGQQLEECVASSGGELACGDCAPNCYGTLDTPSCPNFTVC